MLGGMLLHRLSCVAVGRECEPETHLFALREGGFWRAER